MPRRRPTRWSALAVLFVVTLAAPAAARADGGVGYRVGGEPGSQIDAGFIKFVLPPGGQADGYFYATNTASPGASLAVYPADGLTGPTTGIVYADADDPLEETGTWITPGVRSVAVPGLEERRIAFHVSVPGNAGSGDHVGAVVLEQSNPAQKAGAIKQVVRNVVPIMIEVPGPAGAQIDIITAAITVLPGTTLPAVTVTMRNVGSKICSPVLTVGLRGSGTGQSVSKPLDSMLPGDRAPYALPWPERIEAGSHIVSVGVSNCGAPDSAAVRSRTPAALLPGGTENDLTTTPTKNGLSTDATPGQTTFIPAKKSSGSSAGKKGVRTGGSGAALPRVTPTQVPPNPGSASTATGAAAKGSGGKGLGHWLGGAARAIAENAPAVAKRATFPLGLLALVGMLFFVQEAIARKDPKLMLAPMHREQDMEFDPDPLAGGHVIPLPTALGT